MKHSAIAGGFCSIFSAGNEMISLSSLLLYAVCFIYKAVTMECFGVFEHPKISGKIS